MSRWDDPTGHDDWNTPREQPRDTDRFASPDGSGPREQNPPLTAPGHQNPGHQNPGASSWSDTAPGRAVQDAPRDTQQRGYGMPAMWPGPIPLRPLGFWEVVETAFKVLRHNPRTLFGVTFVVLAVATIASIAFFGLLSLLFSQTIGDIADAATPAGGRFEFDAGSNLAGLTTVVLSGFLIVPIAEAALGRRLSAKESWDRFKGRLLSLIGFSILTGLLYVLMMVPVIALVIAAVISPETFGGGLAAFGWVFLLGALTVVGYLVLSTYLALGPAALVLERLGPIAAIRRSFSLVRGSFWRILGLLVLVGFMTMIALGTLMLPVMLVVGFLAAAAATGGAGAAAGTAGFVAAAVGAGFAVLINTLILPFYAAVYALLYLDRRFRTEALAVDLLAEAERG
ncbi:MAG: hypothetical protein Q4G43_14485 [Mobilicoccus sp.]|nr:hypothetical protein [Mobilicoccus sp.]